MYCWKRLKPDCEHRKYKKCQTEMRCIYKKKERLIERAVNTLLLDFPPEASANCEQCSFLEKRNIREEAIKRMKEEKDGK